MYLNGSFLRRLLYSPKGRIGPRDFIKGLALLVLLHALIVMLGAYNLNASSILSFLSIVLLYPLFCLLIKRSHDGGKSGWFAALWFFCLFILWFIASAIAQNIWGGELLVEMNTKTLAAFEAQDWGEIIVIAEEYAAPMAKQINVGTGVCRFAALLSAGVLINMMIGADPNTNKYGPPADP